MIKRISFFIINLVLCLSAFAQSDSVALEINDKPIYFSQVREAVENSATNGFDFDLDAYIDRLILVEEAKYQKLDTLLTHRREMSTARILLSEQFENDKDIQDSVARILYNRLLVDVDINQIFIPINGSEKVVLPSDSIVTLAYKKADEAEEKLLTGKGLTDYSKAKYIVGKLENLSGHLGWVMPFTMPMEVEDAMYKLPIGEISQPIRSEKGLHIIQVLQRRPTKGAVNYEQVTFNFYTIPPEQKVIDSLWNIVKPFEEDLANNPSEFSELCEAYNKAHKLKKKDCRFNSLNINDNMPPVFINAAFDLQYPGDVSKAILTDYGYHFIRLIDFNQINSFESIQNMLINRIRYSDRLEYIDRLWIEKYSNKFNVQINEKLKNKIEKLSESYKPLDSLFIENLAPLKNEAIFSINSNDDFLVQDLINILIANKKRENYDNYYAIQDGAFSMASSTTQLNEILEGCLKSSLEDYKDSTLVYREPQFRQMLNKISEDALLFDLKKKNIWSKNQITIDERIEYFKKNKKDFEWNAPHYKGIIVESKSETQLDSIRTYYSRLINKSDAKQILISQFKSIRIEEGVWEADYPQIKSHLENNNKSKNKEFPYFIFFGKTIKQPENYRDVVSELDRRILLQREKDWIQSLKETKYKVVINPRALKIIK